MLDQLHWLDVDTDGAVRSADIGTLGPAGTSSEQAAAHLRTLLHPHDDPAPRIHLYPTYEQAGSALREGHIGRLVVANAYAGINAFYMDPTLSLAGAFVLDTPRYGIARAARHRLPRRPSVATHPAPVPLIGELMPAPYETHRVVFTSSTSAAARSAHERRTDAALTTEPAAALHGLEFISDTRPIRMLWSVFTTR